MVEEKPTEKLEKKLAGKGLKFSLRTVSERQVEKVTESLKNKSSSGTDFISPKLIKMSVDIIKLPLWYIINCSIREGQFPKSWKIAKVTPINLQQTVIKLMSWLSEEEPTKK